MMFRQPILADEIQTFKALITVHQVLQEGHPVTLREAQTHIDWLASLTRGVGGEGIRGRPPCQIEPRLDLAAIGWYHLEPQH